MEKVIRVTVAEAEARFEELMEGVLRGEWRWLVVRAVVRCGAKGDG